MQTPVVTLKVEPRDLQLIDAALGLLSKVSLMVVQAAPNPSPENVYDKGMEILCLPFDIADDIAEGDPRRIVLRANKLRRDIGLGE